MITRNTVFVIGAGGSCPYGFPSGAALLRAACDEKELLETLSPFHARREIRLLSESVAACSDISLDALLEHRPDIIDVGRTFIAYSILVAEGQCVANRDTAADWLVYLFSEMASGCPNTARFFRNSVGFITYNYDRLIEMRMRSGVAARFYRTTRPTRENPHEPRVEDIPIVHLHGSLGPLSTTPFGTDPAPNRDTGRSCLVHASQSIQVVHEARADSLECLQARQLLSQAEVIFFLGFSFGRTNVDRLPLHAIPKTAKVIASRYGMTQAETRLNIMQPFDKHELPAPLLGGPDDDCLQVLRDHVDLFVDRYG